MTTVSVIGDGAAAAFFSLSSNNVVTLRTNADLSTDNATEYYVGHSSAAAAVDFLALIIIMPTLTFILNSMVRYNEGW